MAVNLKNFEFFVFLGIFLLDIKKHQKPAYYSVYTKKIKIPKNEIFINNP
jgi:hypothetical protein